MNDLPKPDLPKDPQMTEKRLRRRPVSFSEVLKNKGWKIYGIAFLSGFTAFSAIEIY